MTEMLNKTFETNYTYVQINGYYNNRNIDSGLDGQFQKGCTPANKGKKGTGGWEPTQFKKGHRPVNFRPVGSERVNIDGYTEIKIADSNKWRLKHQVVWELVNGPMPKGHGVIFGDGNRSNCDIENLILVSLRQLLTLNRNRLIQKDADMTRSAIIIVDITHKITDRTKTKRGEKL